MAVVSTTVIAYTIFDGEGNPQGTMEIGIEEDITYTPEDMPKGGYITALPIPTMHH